MGFSIPAPLNGWRIFVGEVGIIVLGVLIALGAGQLVEMWQWRNQIKQADELFRTEMNSATLNAYMQLAIEPCLTEQLTTLSKKLDEPAGKWIGLQETLDWKSVGSLPPETPTPYSGSSHFSLITTDGWDNALANGTISHLPFNRSIMLSRAYAAARQLTAYQREEERLSALFEPLGTDRMLDEESRLRLSQQVSDTLRVLSEIRSASNQVLLNAKQAGLGFDNASLHSGDAGNNEFLLGLERSLRGACVKKPDLT